MISTIALAGIIVCNSILLLGFINLIHDGVDSMTRRGEAFGTGMLSPVIGWLRQ